MPAKRSNKTARVLNLIATPGETEEHTAEMPAPHNDEPAQQDAPAAKAASSGRAAARKPRKAAAPAPETPEPPAQQAETVPTPSVAATTTAPAATPQPVVPLVQTVREKEQQVSDDIKAGLMQALMDAEAAEPAPQSASPDAPAQQEQDATSAAPQQNDTPNEKTADPQQSASDVSPHSAETPHSSHDGDPNATPSVSPSGDICTPLGEQDVVYTNVLQELVENSAPYYVKNMLSCTCQRCIADMKALALTNLPSKYVVLEKSKQVAYMSFYAAKYEKMLSVQMMRACVIVNEHPHH